MATYLVTGGCGFIGSQLTKKLLDKGDKVIVVDDLSNGKMIYPEARLVVADINQFDVMRSLLTGIDGCFHLAAIPAVNIDLEQWFAVHKTNLEGSLTVFKAAIDAGNVPVVYASSCSVYGKDIRLPLAESQFIQPESAYGCDKLSTELNANFLASVYQLPSMGLRLFNVYGPFQPVSSPYSGVITRFIMQLLEDKPLTIFDDGQQTRDFVFIEDVVDNLVHAMNILKKNAHVINICTGKAITIHQLAALLSKLLKKEGRIDYQPLRGADSRHSYGSQTKMEAYGFKIKVDIEAGLLKTIDYFKSPRS